MIQKLKLQNFKGRSAEYDFHIGNVVLAPNFAGKSAIDQAIRHLVLGYIPGAPKTDATLKKFASGLPMTIEAIVSGRAVGVTLEKVKSAVKLTRDETLATVIDEQTRILFDPSIFFGLSDSARISKACELVQSQGFTREQIEAAIVAEVGQDPTMLRYLADWRASIKAATVNDLLTTAEDWWKATRKQVNEEKARMQKTVEGVADMSTGDTVLPPRSEAELLKRTTAERIQALNGQIAVAREGVAHQQMRQKTIDRLTAATQGRAEIVADLGTNEAHAKLAAEEIETLLAKKNAAQRAVDSANQTAAHAERVAKLRQSAQREPELRVNLTALQDALAREEAKLEQLRTSYRGAEQGLVEAKTEANHATAPEPGAEIRTDEFAGEPGKEYLIRATVSVGPDGEMTDIRVTEWQELTTPDPEAIEAAQMAAYEAHQAVAVAAEEVDRIRLEMEQASRHTIELRKQRDAADAQLSSACGAADLLSSAGEVQTVGDIDTLRRELAQVTSALNGAKASLASKHELIRTLRDRLSKIDAAASELATLNAQQVGPAPTPSEVAAMEQELNIAKATRTEIDAMLEKIVRAEQDCARIAQAAKQRETVEATYKAIGKVIDLIAQKKQELVSGSIEAPLAIANKLAAGILRGRLVFEEGEIGMRLGDQLITGIGFSGTEAAIVVMALTAGLAASASHRVLILDEVGRLDPANKITLVHNLRALVEASHIDQWIIIGPTDPQFAAEAKALDVNLITP